MIGSFFVRFNYVPFQYVFSLHFYFQLLDSSSSQSSQTLIHIQFLELQWMSEIRHPKNNFCENRTFRNPVFRQFSASKIRISDWSKNQTLVQIVFGSNKLLQNGLDQSSIRFSDALGIRFFRYLSKIQTFGNWTTVPRCLKTGQVPISDLGYCVVSFQFHVLTVFDSFRVTCFFIWSWPSNFSNYKALFFASKCSQPRNPV